MWRQWIVCGVVLGLSTWSAVAAGAQTKAEARRPVQVHRFAPLKKHPRVVLTFDDLPAAGGLHVNETRVGILTRLSNELKAAHLKGVYGFVIGSDTQDDSDSDQALRVWVNAGMNLGNHTWSHPELTGMTAAAYEENIERDEPVLRQYAGKRDWHWFRYPYLEEGETPQKRNEVRQWLHDRGYRVAQVMLNFQDDDWDDPYGRCLAKHDEAGIAWLKQSYMENAREFIRVGRQEEVLAFGHEVPSVLLLHGTDFTTLMLPDLIQMLRQEGFRFIPLAKAVRNAAYQVSPAAGQPQGGSLPDEILNSRHITYPRFKPEPVQKLDSICR